MGPTPCYSKNQVHVCMPSFRSAAPFFFLVEVPLLALFNTERCVANRHARDIPLVTLILNIYVLVGLTASVNRGHRDKQTIHTL